MKPVSALIVLGMVATSLVIAQTTRPAADVRTEVKWLLQALTIYANDNRNHLPEFKAHLKKYITDDVLAKDHLYLAPLQTNRAKIRNPAKLPLVFARDGREVIVGYGNDVVTAFALVEQQSDSAPGAAATARVRQLGNALITFAAENDGKAPERLSQLRRFNALTAIVPDKVKFPDDFAQRAEREQDEFVDANTDVIYTAPRVRLAAISKHAERPIFFLRDSDDARLYCVGFADGHVETFREVPAPATQPAK